MLLSDRLRGSINVLILLSISTFLKYVTIDLARGNKEESEIRRGNLKICTAHADVGQGGAEILVAHSIPLRRCAR